MIHWHINISTVEEDSHRVLQVQMEWNFWPFIRASHYPGLKATELSLTEQEEILGGTCRIFRPPSKLEDLFIFFIAWRKIINNNHPSILLFGILREKQQIKFHLPYVSFAVFLALSPLMLRLKFNELSSMLLVLRIHGLCDTFCSLNEWSLLIATTGIHILLTEMSQVIITTISYSYYSSLTMPLFMAVVESW